MCGIAGIVTRHGALPDEAMLLRMSDRLAHRGPDGSGVWNAPGVGLAHRRLAIIDLNATGAQPMHVAPYSIVFNGEIYNYRELRAALEKRGVSFRTSSDTEVILEAYRAYGVKSFSMLRGMFAFALWDATRKACVVVRDRIGKKPLFYGFTSTHDLVFASELKAFDGVLPMKPDWDAVRLFLGLQYVPSPRTGFEGVMQLEPGEYGVFDREGWRIERYHMWEGEPGTVPALGGFTREPGSNDEIDARIRTLLEDGVRIRQMASDVPVGAFLSGGVDSALIVALATKRTERSLQTFTMGFASTQTDERSEARALAAHFGTDHQEFEARPEDLLTLIDELVRHYDAPYADSSALPLWLLAQETAREIKVVLTGDGGDELFGGYRRYVAYDRALRIPRVAGMMFETMGHVTRDARFERMATAVRTRSYGEMFCGSYFDTIGVHRTFAPEFCTNTDHADAVVFVDARTPASVDAAMRFDLTSYLPDDLNVKMDRATMRHGLEARAPFLDQEVVAYALGLPLNQKIAHGKTKVALKRAIRGLVPDDVLRRPKRGFQVPLAEWFRGPLRTMLRDQLLDPHAPIAGIVNANAVTQLIAANDRGTDHGNRLWMLLSLSRWLAKVS